MSRASFAAVIWLLWPHPAMAQDTAEELTASPRILDAIDSCNASPSADEIVVCGNRRDRDRYRIAQLGERNSVVGAGNVRGEVPRASAEPIVSGGCGIFQGQRRCSDAEMAASGYGGGRDPITFLVTLATRLANPDADVP